MTPIKQLPMNNDWGPNSSVPNFAKTWFLWHQSYKPISALPLNSKDNDWTNGIEHM